MRVTNQMLTENAIRHMSSNLESINQLQEKVSTGKEFQVSSDAPTAASLSLKLRSNLTTLKAYQNTASLASDWMTASDYAFQEMQDVATKAINLATSGLSDTMSADERKNALGVEMDGLLKQAIDLANTNVKGQYIFAGNKINTRPFTVDDNGVITYNGDTGVMSRNLGPGQSVTINTVGRDAFMHLMQTISQARDALNTNQTDNLRDLLGDLQTDLDTVSMYCSANGARMRQVDQASDYLTKSKTEMESLLNSNENINTAEGISLLNNQQTTYQAVLEVSKRAISSLSLFDYLS